MEEIEFLISQYVDGELSSEEQKQLFKELSLNSEARKLFEEYLNLKKQINKSFNKKIADSFINTDTKTSFNYKLAFYSSVAAILVLLTVKLLGPDLNLLPDGILIENTGQKAEIENIDQTENSYLEQVSKMRTVKITDADLVGKKL